MSSTRTTKTKRPELSEFAGQLSNSTVSLIKACTDLAIAHPVFSTVKARDILMLHKLDVRTTYFEISFWCNAVENLGIAYQLGYLGIIKKYGVDFLYDCLQTFNLSRSTALFFRLQITPFLAQANVALPVAKQIWAELGTLEKVKVVSVQANLEPSLALVDEILVFFVGTSEVRCLPLLEFIDRYVQTK